MLEGGLLVALQTRVMLLYSRTVWLLGAWWITAGSGEDKRHKLTAVQMAYEQSTLI